MGRDVLRSVPRRQRPPRRHPRRQTPEGESSGSRLLSSHMGTAGAAGWQGRAAGTWAIEPSADNYAHLEHRCASFMCVTAHGPSLAADYGTGGCICCAAREPAAASRWRTSERSRAAATLLRVPAGGTARRRGGGDCSSASGASLLRLLMLLVSYAPASRRLLRSAEAIEAFWRRGLRCQGHGLPDC